LGMAELQKHLNEEKKHRAAIEEKTALLQY
jgi:hypothetical protein